ncbi:MAG: PA14 domain-containing protein, partial [Verrucomicrobia bacterium]|nr:PA14 domain-containing protein [Verrucomicrobiota bacterium]
MRPLLRQRIVALLLLIFAAAYSPLRATWYNENIENGADLIMMDLRWPWWPSATYFANWNSGFNPKPNNLSFYAGFQSADMPDGPGFRPHPDDKLQEAFRPANTWSFWGTDKDGSPIRVIDAAPNLFLVNNYGGEGTSAYFGAEPWPFIKCRRWYTMLARVWQPQGGGNQAYVGRWIKDLANGHWHFIGMARLPIPATSFHGNCGFIEPLTDERVVRSLHRRLGYFRKDGQWKKSNAISIEKTVYVVVNTVPEGDHEYVAIEYAGRPDLLPLRLTGKPLEGDKKYSFKAKQPELPVLDKPAVANVSAETTGRQVAVSWEVPETASPAFAYKIEVFDNAECRGEAKVVREERMPNARHALVDAVVPSATVRLTVTDIFDQAAPAVTPVVAASKPAAPPQAVAATVPGLAYDLFHQDTRRMVNYFEDPLHNPREEHYWLTLDEISQGKLFRQGLARGFDLNIREQRNSGYALIFKGFLRVPTDGLYLLRAQIDGAYRIQIDGQDALVWDGQHGTTEKAAVRQLSKGEHPLTVTHLYDQLPASNFAIDWEGPGLPRQAIPLEALRVEDDGSYPQPVVKAENAGDGTGRIEVMVATRGHTVNKTVLFLGQLQIAETHAPELRFHGPLPAGTNTFWSRVIFDGNHSVDSDRTTVQVTGKPVDPSWTVRNVGDARASAGLWQTGPQDFQFFGNGMHTVTKKVNGDFTATCRVDAYAGAHGEPVNPSAWVGLTAREFGERLNWEWGENFHLVQLAAHGLRASAEYTDGAGTRISSYELPKGHPWLRIVRQGNLWMAWSSAEGKQWELGAYQFKKAQPQMDVGLFISALPQEARAHYQASVSELSIEPGVRSDSAVPAPPIAQHTEGERLTGVTMARSDPQVVVVRSTSSGLTRTVDGGKTWTLANGNLTGADLAVRSVAIHPENPSIMLRACGRGDGAGSLWRTTDGGNNWEKLPLE